MGLVCALSCVPRFGIAEAMGALLKVNSTEKDTFLDQNKAIIPKIMDSLEVERKSLADELEKLQRKVERVNKTAEPEEKDASQTALKEAVNKYHDTKTSVGSAKATLNNEYQEALKLEKGSSPPTSTPTQAM